MRKSICKILASFCVVAAVALLVANYFEAFKSDQINSGLVYLQNIKCYLKMQLPKALEGKECVLLEKANPVYYFCKHPNGDQFSERVACFQVWEVEIQNVIKWFFEKNSYNATFVDLGANVGLHAMYAAKLNKTVDVVAVEPFIENVYRFKKATILNDVQNQIQILLAGVSNRSGFIDMKDNTRIVVKCCSTWKEASSGKIALITIDDLIPLIKKPTVFLKIDIEGGECTLFSHARKFFTKFNVEMIIMETGPTVSTKSHECVQSMFDFLSEFKYKGFFPYKNLRLNKSLEFSTWHSLHDPWKSSTILFVKF